MVYFMGALLVKLSPASLLVFLEKLGGQGPVLVHWLFLVLPSVLILDRLVGDGCFGIVAGRGGGRILLMFQHFGNFL